MRKVTQSLLITLSSLLALCGCDNREMRNETLKPIKFSQPTLFEYIISQQQMKKKNDDNSKNKNVEKNPTKPKINKRPVIKGISLNDEILEYIWKECQREGISYFAFLALIKAESDFDIKKVNRNKNGTKDYGLIQINSVNIKSISTQLGIKNVDVFNPEHNIKMGIAELKTCREYWSKTYSGEKLERATLIAYNRGIAGSRKWIKKNGLNNIYANKIFIFKKELYKGKI